MCHRVGHVRRCAMWENLLFYDKFYTSGSHTPCMITLGDVSSTGQVASYRSRAPSDFCQFVCSISLRAHIPLVREGVIRNFSEVCSKFSGQCRFSGSLFSFFGSLPPYNNNQHLITISHHHHEPHHHLTRSHLVQFVGSDISKETHRSQLLMLRVQRFQRGPVPMNSAAPRAANFITLAKVLRVSCAATDTTSHSRYTTTKARFESKRVLHAVTRNHGRSTETNTFAMDLVMLMVVTW